MEALLLSLLIVLGAELAQAVPSEVSQHHITKGMPCPATCEASCNSLSAPKAVACIKDCTACCDSVSADFGDTMLFEVSACNRLGSSCSLLGASQCGACCDTVGELCRAGCGNSDPELLELCEVDCKAYHSDCSAKCPPISRRLKL